MADKTIVAMAIGNPNSDRIIRNWSNLNGVRPVRPYILGLMQGLANRGHEIGDDYIIDYRERTEAHLIAKGGADAEFKLQPELPSDHIIFCMSTTVVRAAQNLALPARIVGIVSDPVDEGFGGGHIFGVSARRSQTAGVCLERFLRTVQGLTDIHVLHKEGYRPSERALGLVKAMAAQKRVNVIEEVAGTLEALKEKLDRLPERNPTEPPKRGVLALPVDLFLSAAKTIIDVTQGAKKLPAFFPITDRVEPDGSGALGGYGIPQRMCGMLLAERVDRLWQSSVNPPVQRFTDAPDEVFEWWASRKVAQALSINLPASVPQI